MRSLKEAIARGLEGNLWEPPSKEGKPYLYTGLVYQVLRLASGEEGLERALKGLVERLLRRGLGHLKGEPYVGAFMLELGMIKEFKEQAAKVAEYLRSLEEVVVLDPITFRLLTETYPKLFGLKLKVTMYYKLLDEEPDFRGCKLGDKCCGGHLYFLAPTMALSMSKETGFKEGSVACPLGWLNLRKVAKVRVLGA